MTKIDQLRISAGIKTNNSLKTTDYRDPMENWINDWLMLYTEILAKKIVEECMDVIYCTDAPMFVTVELNQHFGFKDE